MEIWEGEGEDEVEETRKMEREREEEEETSPSFNLFCIRHCMQDPDCYNQRSEKKKIKNGMKLKLRRESLSISKVVCAIIWSMLSTTTTTSTTPTPC
jgi:hypothetical protein